MLGPMDLEGWLDGNEDEDLCARLRQTPQIQMLDRDPSVAGFSGWSAFDFSLARRFCESAYLDTHELHKLADRLGV